jgi:hypothetical protein
MLSGKLRKGESMAASFYEVKTSLFQDAKALLESFGPSSEYMASAVHAADGYCYAAYAAPGWVPEFVYDVDGPYVTQDMKTAEAKAREMLFNTLNANLEEGWIDGLRPKISN